MKTKNFADGQLPVSRRDFLGGTLACALTTTAFGKSDTPCVRMGFITDCHYAAHLGVESITPEKLKRNALGVRKLEMFTDEMNRLKVDFVIEGGDFKDLGRTREESLVYLDEMERAFSRFKGPKYHVLGNHDHDNLTKEEFLAHIGNEGQSEPRAWYSFDRGGIRFIVLDACYRPDGTPYSRGNFFWKDTMLPEEQIRFLEQELASAPGLCVPIVHQQLDAEDETCIRNAAEIRRILEASGKVKCVVQGHLHEGAFREVNGIGYVTVTGNVLGDVPTRNAFSLFEFGLDGSVTVRGFGGARSYRRATEGYWSADTTWRKGHYQVHHIFTGRGESIFHVFPDGTSMLVDVGDSMRFYGTAQETPHLPDVSRRAGEWVSRYVGRANPKGRHVDYFLLTHYHEDHGGGERYHGGTVSAPTGDYLLSGLADAARFLEFDTIVDRAWPDFSDPVDALKTSRDGTSRNIRKVYAALQANGTKIVRFELGSRKQFCQRNVANARTDFSVFNLCANGRFVRRDGSIAEPYAERLASGVKKLNENGMSCGMVVSYGPFRYFAAGDFSDRIPGSIDSKSIVEIEDALGDEVSSVDVAKCNHHGHHSMSEGLVRGLAARVWTNCTLDQQHMTDDTMVRLTDRKIYAEPRFVVPTYMPQSRKKIVDDPKLLADVPKAVIEEPCHVVLDVDEDGLVYTITCVSAADEIGRIRSDFGVFTKAK